MAAASKRLAQEKAMINSLGFRCFQNIEVDAKNIFLWKGLLVPDEPPYNEGAFHIEISFPKTYPLGPPKVNFKTPIYHPNVDEDGQMCLPIISREHWKCSTHIDQVIEALILLVNNPDPDYPFRADLAKEFKDHPENFQSKAKEHTRLFSEKRPCQ